MRSDHVRPHVRSSHSSAISRLLVAPWFLVTWSDLSSVALTGVFGQSINFTTPWN